MKHVEFYRNDKDGSVLVSVGTQVPEKLIYAGQELTPRRRYRRCS